MVKMIFFIYFLLYHFGLIAFHCIVTIYHNRFFAAVFTVLASHTSVNLSWKLMQERVY